MQLTWAIRSGSTDNFNKERTKRFPYHVDIQTNHCPPHSPSDRRTRSEAFRKVDTKSQLLNFSEMPVPKAIGFPGPGSGAVGLFSTPDSWQNNFMKFWISRATKRGRLVQSGCPASTTQQNLLTSVSRLMAEANAHQSTVRLLVAHRSS